MMEKMANKQRGITMSGFMVAVVVFILVAIAGMKIIPAYIQDKTIKSKFEEVARDPELKNATVHDIRMSYIRRVTTSDITAIKADDIEVTKDASGITLSASYSVKIPLFGNASLILEFNPSSATQ
jgi:YbbR domain-containing protein